MSRFQMLSDAQWSLIQDVLPRPTGRRGRPFSDARRMVEAIIYRYRCGIAWRDLPEVYGPWQTVWTWHRRMASEGTWDHPQHPHRRCRQGRTHRLVRLRRLDHRACPSARDERHTPHRGLHRITRI